MRLIHEKTQEPVLEFQGGKTVIHNKLLEYEMRSIGIPIPHGLRGVYEGKESVYLGEEQFQRAFREIYYLMYMKRESFRWSDTTD